MSAPEMPAWLLPPVAWPGPPVAQKYSEPRRLTHTALLEFRDSLHEDSCMYAASGAEVDLWLAQLDEAIDAGEVDPRPSWQLAAAEEADRVAAVVVERLQALQVIQPAPKPAPAPRESAPAATEPEPAQPIRATASTTTLLRAGDVGMTPREWRAAIHRGVLQARKIGREYVATREDFDAYLAARQVAARPALERAKRLDPAMAAVDRALASGRLRVVRGGHR